MATINYQTARFEASYGTVAQLPASTTPEVAVTGRSNVGKSSLLNKLFNRKGLVKVSSTPGKTANINFFDLDRSFNLVVSLVDIRHDAQKLDHEMVGFLRESELPFVVALTKADKLGRSKQTQQAATIARQLGIDREQVVVTSSETGQGIDELRRRIAEACL